MSVLVDRAVGASSIHDGELEIMLHRYYLMKSLEQVLVSCYCGRYSSSKILCCIVCQRCPLEGGGGCLFPETNARSQARSQLMDLFSLELL